MVNTHTHIYIYIYIIIIIIKRQNFWHRIFRPTKRSRLPFTFFCFHVRVSFDQFFFCQNTSAFVRLSISIVTQNSILESGVSL
jgi:predicted ferric reductase